MSEIVQWPSRVNFEFSPKVIHRHPFLFKKFPLSVHVYIIMIHHYRRLIGLVGGGNDAVVRTRGVGGRQKVLRGMSLGNG